MNRRQLVREQRKHLIRQRLREVRFLAKVLLDNDRWIPRARMRTPLLWEAGAAELREVAAERWPKMSAGLRGAVVGAAQALQAESRASTRHLRAEDCGFPRFAQA